MKPANGALHGEQLFGRLRRNLTLLYAGVLAAMLLVMGLALYLALPATAVGAGGRACSGALPVSRRLSGSRRAGTVQPGAGSGRIERASRPPRPPTEGTIYLVCFDTAGTVLRANIDPRP